MTRLFAILCAALMCFTKCWADPANAVVIVYAQFPGANSYEIGTGAFVDHDGLVLTADHVVHHISLTPPSTSQTSTVSTVTPVSISVYSAFLNKKFDVDLTSPGVLVGGQINPNQWLDVALIRVSLTNAQKAMIQPLDIATSAPSQADVLRAYGPLCPTNDARCFQPAVAVTALSSNPTTSRDYQVQASITTGYSGGPLVNSSDNIVAIASWGDITSGNQVFRASYTPAQYILHYFLSLAPSPSVLSSTNGCTIIGNLPSLTTFDWSELARQWTTGGVSLSSPTQCSCCCQSLDKAKNAVIPASFTSNCAPPFCAQQQLYGLTNAMDIAIAAHAPEADTAQIYTALSNTYQAADLSGLSQSEQKTLFTKIGNSIAKLSALPGAVDNGSFSGSTALALNVLQRGQSIEETPEDYKTMGSLFKAEGDLTNSTAANVLSTISVTDQTDIVKKLDINPDTLRLSVANAISQQGTSLQ